VSGQTYPPVECGITTRGETKSGKYSPLLAIDLRHLCKKIFAKLPRELRDIVDGHVATLEYLGMGPRYFNSSVSFGEVNYSAQYLGRKIRGRSHVRRACADDLVSDVTLPLLE
jgi:hypothetical protein